MRLMNRRRQILFLFLISAITSGLVGYTMFRWRRPIDEDRAAEFAKLHAKPPEGALFLGVRLLNISGERRYVVSWKVLYESLWPLRGRLIEVQVSRRGRVLDVLDYPLPREEFRANISRVLAYQIAERVLSTETNYSSSSPELIGPLVDYRGDWQFSWKRRVGVFTIFGASFIVSVDADTGETRIMLDTLEEAPRLEAPERVEVSREQAVNIAELFVKQYENVTSIYPSETELGFIEHPEGSSNYVAVWRIRLMGRLYGDQFPQHGFAGTVIVDAITGRVLDAIFLS